MKILHFADAHIGATTHGVMNSLTGFNDRVEDFLDAFDFILDYIEENAVDLVLFAGDMFHHNTPSPSLISAVAIRIKEISTICPIVMIPGNHDQAMNRVSAIQFFEELDLPNVHISDYPTHYVLEIAGHRVFIGAMPYPTYGMFDLRPSDGNVMLMEEVNSCISNWWGDIANADWLYASILLMHGTIQGVRWGSYTGTALGADSSLLLEHVNRGWDYVALGHIHLHQDLTYGLNGKSPIVYAGSIERVDFGEAAEPKGFVVITIEDDAELEYQFIELPARPFHTLKIDLRDVEIRRHHAFIKQAIKCAKLHPDTILRVIVKALDRSNVSIAEVTDLVGSSVYRLVSVTAIVEIEQRSKIKQLRADYGIDDVTKLDPVGMLELYLDSIGTDDETIDVVLDLFEDIEEEL